MKRFGFKGMAISIGLATAIVAVSLILFGVSLMSRVSAVETLWVDYNRDAAQANYSLSQVRAHFGYGGFIHNFKNFILRHDEALVPKIEQNLIDAQAALSTFETLSHSPDEKAAIAVIRKTLNTYEEKLVLAIRLFEKDMPPRKLDALVKVNDQPALNALRFLTDQVLKESKAQESATSQSLDETIRFGLWGGLIVPGVLGIGILLTLFLYRLLKANEAAETARKNVDNLLENAPDAMINVNQAGQIVRANAQAGKLLGYTSEELKELSVDDLVPRSSKSEHAAYRTKYFASGDARPMSRGTDLVAVTESGQEVPVEISLSFLMEDDHPLATATIRDVSQRKLNQDQLIEAREEAEGALRRLEEAHESLVQSEKLAALGGLVAGVAHEINTPVGITLSSASHLEKETTSLKKLYDDENLEPEHLDDYLETAEHATRLMINNCHRAAELIQSFKQVAVDQTGGERRTFNVKDYIEEVLTSLRPNLKRSFHKVKLVCPDKLEINSKPGALSQCITNLMMNSLAHAFEEDETGTIKIDVSVDEDDMVKLIYSDDGKGIPEELCGQVFDPFFTTKRGSGGSGLGLNIVYNIVHQTLNGSTDLKSEEGKGTTITLSFPRVLPT